MLTEPADRVPAFLCCREPVCVPRPRAVVGLRVAVDGAINQVFVCVKCGRDGVVSEELIKTWQN
jgi:hypothetical protein